MTKEQILKAIERAEISYGKEFNLDYDEQIDRLFYELEILITMPVMVYLRCDSSATDFWLQAEYYSKKLQKTIIWNYDVGNFDDYDEVADFIVNTSEEIKDFESKITLN